MSLSRRMQSVDPRAVLRHFVKECGSQSAAGRALGLTPSYVNHLVSGRRKFPKRVLKLLGLASVVVKTPTS